MSELQPTPDSPQEQAACILEEEANQLSLWVMDRKGDPHRVTLAIMREMRRLREIATVLRSSLPSPDPEEDDDRRKR